MNFDGKKESNLIRRFQELQEYQKRNLEKNKKNKIKIFTNL